MSGSEKSFRAKRKKQLDSWKAEHKESPRKAAQHLHGPGKKTKTATKKAAGTKKTAPKKAAKRPAAKKTTARKRTSRTTKKAA